MKITTVIGSPKVQGHGAKIAAALLALLGEHGAHNTTYELNRLTYRGCQACLACKTETDVCVERDDLSAILSDIRQSDVVIVAAPVFMGEVSAQAKGLFDRFYSFLGPDFRTNPRPGRLAAGKTLVFILTQGNPDKEMFGSVLSRQARVFHRCGFSAVLPIHACGVGSDSDADLDAPTMALIAETAKKLRA